MHTLPFPPRGRPTSGHAPDLYTPDLYAPDLRPLPGSQLRNALEAFHFGGEPPVAARAQMKSDFGAEDDHRLADDIARAMHNRPLMSRLARVEAAHGDAAVTVARSAIDLVTPREEPAVTRASPPPPAVELRSIEEVIDDLGYAASPPPSAAWLEKARRAKTLERRRHALAWVTTLAIAGVILTGTYLLLHV